MRAWLVVALLLTPMASALTIVDGGLGPGGGEPSHRPELKELDRIADQMEKHWYRLDKSCDPKAAFGLAYLMTTRSVQAHIDAGYFEDNDFLVIWTIGFAEAYLDAFEEYEETGRTTPAWQEAFTYAESGRASVMESLLQGMSAHINYDLAIVSSALEMPEDGRYDEFTRVNDALWYAMRASMAELGRQYTSELEWTSADDPGNHATMGLVEAWREQAWHNAVLLSSASTDAERDLIMAQITANAIAVAKSQESPKSESTTPERVAYCEAQNADVRNKNDAYWSPRDWYTYMGEDPDVYAQRAQRSG